MAPVLRSARRHVRIAALLLFGAMAACKSDAMTTPETILPSGGAAEGTLRVGDILRVNVNGVDACTNPTLRGARVVAISNRAVIVNDTLNPPGFSTTQFERFAARFDTLVYPIDVAAFGEPTDIDRNGRIVLVFTRAVNELTPRASSQYVGGFAYSRDLFPKTAGPRSRDDCPGSNVGEFFYLLAPDPSGTINSNVRTTTFVDSVTTSVIAHEFQHIINASRRFYVNNADAFEAKWLDEGLSHIAEELLFQRESGYGPKMNLTIQQVRASPQTVLAYNNDMAGNATRYRAYLQAPSRSSPYAPDDSLPTRGAAWSLLRYAADRVTDAAPLPAGQAQLVSGPGSLTAAAGGEYFAIVHNNSFGTPASSAFTIQATGITPPSTSLAPSPSAARAEEEAGRALTRDVAWEERLRDRERALTPRIAAARQWYAMRGGNTVGALRSRAALAVAAPDDAFFLKLANNRDTGTVNFAAAIGGDVGGFVRDWTVSHAVDDLAQLGTSFQQRSWNWRSIYPALGQGTGTYPLLVTTMVNGATPSGTVVPGGAAFYRLAVPAAGPATVTLGGTSSSSMQLILVRYR